MSIVTKTGDDGTTGLMYNRRVPKSSPRVDAYGSVDELNAALGMARSTVVDRRMASRLLEIQRELVTLMGELAVAGEDLERYKKDGFKLVEASMTQKLEAWVKEIEAGGF